MPQRLTKPTFNRHTITAVDDTAFRLTDVDMWYNDVDIQVQTNKAYIGDKTDQDIETVVGDVWSYRFCNLKDIFFKNFTAGSNVKIVCIGTLMSPAQIEEHLRGWD